GTTFINGNTYSWSPATGLSNPNTANPNANPTTTTTYIVTVNNASNGCIDEDTMTLFVNPKPVPAFAPVLHQCLNGNNFTFLNSSTGASTYTWTFGDGNSSAAFNPTHSYTIAQNYSVKLVVAGL